MKIGIFGGTFDPIHHGHLIIAETICEEANLDRIIFVPSFQTPLKEKVKLTNSKLRFDMVDKAIAHNQRFSISDFEYLRQEKVYTIETLNYFQKKFPLDQLYFIIGEDSYRNFNRWSNYQEILERFNVICARRKGGDDSSGYSDGRIKVYGTPNIQISSTLIRDRIHNKKSVKYLVPSCVEEMLFQHKLYL